MNQNETPGLPNREALNQQSKETLLDMAEVARKKLMMSVYESFKSAMAADSEQIDRLAAGNVPSGEQLLMFVEEDPGEAPFLEDMPAWTLSLRLERDTEIGQQGNEVLKLFIPVPRDFEWEDDDEEREFPMPDTLYFARYEKSADGKDRLISRRAVTANTFFSYKSAADKRDEVGEGEDWFDYDDSEFLLQDITFRVNTRTAEVVELFQDIVNMKVVPQYTYVHNKPNTELEALN